MAEKEEKKELGCGAALVISLLLLLGVFVAIAVIERISPKYPKEKGPGWTFDEERKVYSAAKELVSDQLKAPSTASFPWMDYQVYRSGDDWTVLGYVDAQNGYGAMLRSNWKVEMIYTGRGWKAKKVVIEPR